ncbi:MAG: ATP-binding protein [Ktedonobacteraceae bacterium]
MEGIIFCGLQASGKSTFYREHFATTHLLISKDLLHANRRPEQRQAELIQMALQAQHSIVIDNTNPTPLVRAPLIEQARAYHASIIGYYFTATVQQAMARNQQRNGKARVPAVAIYSTATRMIPPTYAEGFDRLYYVRIAENSTLMAPAWQIEEIFRG